MRIKMLMILTFQPPLIKMGSNSLLKKKKMGSNRVWINQTQNQDIHSHFCFQNLYMLRIEAPTSSPFKTVCTVFCIVQMYHGLRQRYIHIYIYIYILASSHALHACGEAFFFQQKKKCFYFENLIYKCFFFFEK